MPPLTHAPGLFGQRPNVVARFLEIHHIESSSPSKTSQSVSLTRRNAQSIRFTSMIGITVTVVVLVLSAGLLFYLYFRRQRMYDAEECMEEQVRRGVNKKVPASASEKPEGVNFTTVAAPATSSVNIDSTDSFFSANPKFAERYAEVMATTASRRNQHQRCPSSSSSDASGPTESFPHVTTLHGVGMSSSSLEPVIEVPSPLDISELPRHPAYIPPVAALQFESPRKTPVPPPLSTQLASRGASPSSTSSKAPSSAWSPTSPTTPSRFSTVTGRSYITRRKDSPKSHHASVSVSKHDISKPLPLKLSNSSAFSIPTIVIDPPTVSNGPAIATSPTTTTTVPSSSLQGAATRSTPPSPPSQSRTPGPKTSLPLCESTSTPPRPPPPVLEPLSCTRSTTAGQTEGHQASIRRKAPRIPLRLNIPTAPPTVYTPQQHSLQSLEQQQQRNPQQLQHQYQHQQERRRRQFDTLPGPPRMSPPPPPPQTISFTASQRSPTSTNIRPQYQYQHPATLRFEYPGTMNSDAPPRQGVYV